ENFTNVSIGRVQYIADINYNYGSAVFAPENGAYGVFGVTFENVDYGQLQGTVRSDNTQGYLDFGTFSPSAYAIGLGYAKALSEKFAIGGDIRYVNQSLGTSVVNIDQNGNFVEEQNKTNVLAFDFGIIYKTGFKSLDFGMDVRNFSREVRYKKESFQLPLIFKLGISMNLMDFLPQIDQNMHSFLFTVEATHPRDYPEQISVGGEYTFMKLIALRVGYITPSDVEGVSAGIGIKHNFSGFDFSLDYSYTVYQVFSNVSRISLGFAL
ncbi:MAG TPA: PorV/PorQ family protein, partial [Ignavibacteriaceae bacterium]|nr:PorV/PorQ family protein [Ignavibacteriaceae bacterium]